MRTADPQPQANERPKPKPITVCPLCSAESSGGHICRGVRIPRRTR